MFNTNFVVNKLISPELEKLYFYPDYPEKIEEVERITNTKFLTRELIIDELQSTDPYIVAKNKAYQAWKENRFYPVLIEDTSLYVLAMDGLPSTFVSSFTDTVDKRRLICEIALKRAEHRITAQAILAVFDGTDFEIWESKSHGLIPEEPRGSGGFGWDDIYIPVVNGKSMGKTFAEMKDGQKDKYSMRGHVWRKFLKNSFINNHPIYQIPEPYEEELKRIRLGDLSPKGRRFAYHIESIEKVNKPTNKLSADKYLPITKEENEFYSRYTQSIDSPSLGVILTNIDLDRVEKLSNNEPILWQVGPKRRTLALAQRAHFFDQNQNVKVHKILDKLEKKDNLIPPRSNRRNSVIEKALGYSADYRFARNTPAITELGYKKISTDRIISRRQIITFGLFNKVGKYPRKVIGLGSMPPTTGWRDTIVTAAVGHMVSFIPRNNVFAGNFERRIKLAKEATNVINDLPIRSKWKQRIKRNIGASLGLDDPKKELEIAKQLYKKAGIKLFRIYTIGSDKRVIDMSKMLRKEFGDSIELFVGQIADKKQAELLISPEISVDGLIYGHGGGQQCTSAINGMAITTLEDVYEITKDPAFNETSILVEGGIDRSIGTAILIGIDCCLGNQKLVHGTIETGDIFVQTNKGKLAQPYPGSASPVTQIIESQYPNLQARRTDPSGRTYNAEGKPGFMFFEKKANSMSYWINEYQAHTARTLADLGVRDISELRILLQKDGNELLRIMSEKTQYLSDAFGNHVQ